MHCYNHCCFRPTVYDNVSHSKSQTRTNIIGSLAKWSGSYFQLSFWSCVGILAKTLNFEHNQEWKINRKLVAISQDPFVTCTRLFWWNLKMWPSPGKVFKQMALIFWTVCLMSWLNYINGLYDQSFKQCCVGFFATINLSSCLHHILHEEVTEIAFQSKQATAVCVVLVHA